MPEGDATGGDEPNLAVELAHEIRRLREAADLTLADVGGIAGYTRQYISFAERPRRGLPSAALVRALDRALGAGGALIELHKRASAQRDAVRASMVQESADHAPELEEVDTSERRELPTVAVAVAFGASLDQPALRIIAQADESQVPTTVRPGDVRELQTATEMLADWEARAGGTAVRHHILGALRWGIGLLKSSGTPEVRCSLATTTAQLADLAAWATFDAGLNTQARELSLLGLHLAHESGDLGIRSHVANGLALQEIHRGNPDAGLTLVQLAHAAGDVLTPNEVSQLHTVKARAYAKKSDPDQCHRFIQLARDCYQPESLNSDPPWIHYFTPAKLQGDTANALFNLLITNPEPSGARAELVTRLSNTVNRYPQGRARDKAIVAVRLATLLYLEGDVAEANTAAHTALTVAYQVRSARLRSDLRVLAQAASAAHRDSVAQEIRAEANALAATMT